MARPGGSGRRASRLAVVAVVVATVALGIVGVAPAGAETLPGVVLVTPSTHLRHQQFVDVEGIGWHPGESVALAMCHYVSFDLSRCDPETASGFGSADQFGHFQTSMMVSRSLTTQAGVRVECGPGNCAIGAITLDAAGSPQLVTWQPVSFDPVPTTVVPGAASAPENHASGVLDVPVSLSNPSNYPITVDWTTFPGGGPTDWATPVADYTPASGTITFAPGDTAATVPIRVVDDALVEPDEVVVVVFGHPTNARMGGFYGIGFGAITNDDHATVLPGASSILEGGAGTVLSVPVTLSNPSTDPITVQWLTAFVPGAPGAQAEPGRDYTAASGTATFAPGQTTTSVPIGVIGDTVAEPDEYVLVLFGNATNATVGGVLGLGGGTILDDD